MSKKILITGIAGQDGYFLTKQLLERGYSIHGLLRPNSPTKLGSLNNLESHEIEQLILHEGNVTSKDFIDELIRFSQFDEVYHLAAQSSVAHSIRNPRETIETNVLGITNIATAIRDQSSKTRLLFAGSSEMFGSLTDGRQTETTATHPQSPYGLTKELGFHLITTYRKHYGIWAATAILFNHESEFRGDQFVTTKIIKSAVQIAHDKEGVLSLGNIHVERDWGYAEDYVKGLLLMMDQAEPDDYVFATGQLHSVKAFVDSAFKQVGITLIWSGSGLDETARNSKNDQLVVRIDKQFYRPGDIAGTCGQASKAKETLGWSPETPLDTVISKMIQHHQKLRSLEG